MQSKSAPLTQNSAVAQLARDKGGYYWKCWKGDGTGNSKALEMYDKACSNATNTQKNIDKHTHTNTHPIMIMQ